MTLITLTTDFGTSDPWVGIMKGVIASRAPGIAVIDVTHGIPPQDVLAGALVLRHAVPYFPRDAVHVAVVDPGVGTARRALAVEAGESILVGPDNGLLPRAADALGGISRAVVLDKAGWFAGTVSATFHGRDVFAPVAARLALGADLADAGSTVDGVATVHRPLWMSDVDSTAAIVRHALELAR